MQLKKYKLVEIALPGKGIVDGPFGSNLPASDYTKNGIPVIRGCNLSLGGEKFIDNGYIFVSDKTAKRLERSKCIKGDIIFTKKGTLGQIGIIPESSKYETYILSSNQMKLSVDKNVANNQFVYYYLSSKDTIAKIRRESESTGVPKINLGYLKNLEIVLPDLATQTRTASILSSLDNKIELNHRMNQTLEQMAQALFNHYFVDNIGPDNLPDGWLLAKLGEYCNIFRGASPRPITDPRYFSNGTIPWIKISDATASASIYINSTKEHCTELAVTKSRFLEKGSLILSNSATIGIPKILNISGCIHDGWLAFNNLKIISRNYLFFGLVRKLSEFKQIATGSVQDNLNTTLLKETELIIPSEHAIKEFDKVVEPLFEKIRVNDHQISTIISIRDALLPKLMSGEIAVEELMNEEPIAEEGPSILHDKLASEVV